ncbi:phage tail tape measure protein [Fructilactobacillus sanfranciscensis]|uniref:phage tail tape measure protein n=1 Tax=Fructilactobacillus sanfranciscensis TaxID=1625 RepID=UPI0013CF9831|nr:phage tail tape measure protein [Fructilactobacillus sanfranciscensis]NDR97425.1 phage tail tape measure protein [Fructilactobacillus sanfranciscensis]
MAESYSVQAQLSAVDKNFSSAFENAIGVAEKMGKTLTLVGAGTTAFGVMALKSFGNYEKALNQAAVTAGGTAKDIDGLSEVAKHVSATLPVSAQESAEAMIEMAQAGANVSKIKQYFPQIAKAAIASGSDVKVTASTVENAMTIWGNSLKKPERAAAILVDTANLSNASMADMSNALANVGGSASNMGMSMQDTATAIGLLTNHGFSAAQASQDLNHAILQMQAPSSKAKEQMKALGLSFTDAQGNMKPFPNILRDINKALDGLNPSQRAAALKTLFGTAGMGAALPLLDSIKNKTGNAAKSWDGMSAQINRDSKDSATSTAFLENQTNEMQKNVGSSMTQVAHKWQDLIIASMQGTKQISSGYLSMINSALAWAIQSNSAGAQAIRAFIGLSPVIGAAVTAVGGFLTSVTKIGSVMASVGGFMLSPWGLVIAAVVAVVAILVAAYTKCKSLRDAVGKIGDAFTKAFGGTTKGVLDGVMNVISSLITLIGNGLAAALNAIDWNRVFGAVKSIIGTDIQAVQGLIQGFRQTGAAAHIFDAIKLVISALFPIFTQIVNGIAQFVSSSQSASSVSGIFSAIGTAIGIVINFISNVIEYVAKFIQAFAQAGAVKAIITAIGSVFRALGSIIGGIISIVGTIIGKLMSMAGVQGSVSGVGAAFSLIGTILGTLITVIANVITFVANLVTGFMQFLQVSGIMTAVQTVITTEMNVIGTVISTVLAVITTVWSTTWNVLSTVVSTVWNVIVTVITTVITVIQTIITTGLTTIQTIWTTVWGLLGPIVTTVWNAIVTTITTVWTTIQTIIQTGLTIIQTIWSTVWNAIVMVVTTVWNTIVTTITTVWTTIQTFIQTGLSVIQSIWSAIWNAISTVVSTVWNTISSVVMSVFSAVSSFISGTLSTISSIWSAIWNAISTVVSTVWNAISSVVMSVFGAVSSFISSTLSTISSIWSSIWSAVSSVASSVWSAISSFISSSIQTVSSVISSTLSAISSIWSSIWNAVSNVISSVWSSITSIVSGAINGVRSAISSGSQAALSAISSAFHGMVSAVSGAMSSVVSAASSGIHRAYSAISSMIGNFISVGRYIAQGVARGISNGIGWVINAARSLARRALNAAKSALGIHSPSRVMKKQVGRYVSEGMAIGITDNISAVENASDALAQAAIPEIDTRNMVPTFNDADLADNIASANASIDHQFNATASTELSLTQQPANINLNLGNQSYRAFVKDISKQQDQNTDLEIRY